MDYRDRHVIVTGGTGALGTAVVGALVEAGAICHVPYVVAAEAERFALRGHAQRQARRIARASPTRTTSRASMAACRSCGPRSIWSAASPWRRSPRPTRPT